MLEKGKGGIERGFLPGTYTRFSDEVTLRRLRRLELRTISIGSVEDLDAVL
jgi:hypothetical protein